MFRVVRLHGFRHGFLSVLLGLGVPVRTAMDTACNRTIEMTMHVWKRTAAQGTGGFDRGFGVRARRCPGSEVLAQTCRGPEGLESPTF